MGWKGLVLGCCTCVWLCSSILLGAVSKVMSLNVCEVCCTKLHHTHILTIYPNNVHENTHASKPPISSFHPMSVSAYSPILPRRLSSRCRSRTSMTALHTGPTIATTHFKANLTASGTAASDTDTALRGPDYSGAGVMVWVDNGST